ncbi:MAG: D-alanyl-D-alanine carboxypeptidase [Oscillibacter sp.]|nr:D-alanyl-D-alanine carboxypeptidase [Oscillibacter sp.]
MKKTRFLSVFLILACLTALALPIRAAALEDPAIRAKAALLADVETGEIAYAKNEHQQLYPASLTKVMTALLVLEAQSRGEVSFDEVVTAGESAFAAPYYARDGSTANIKAGEELTIDSLLYCMLVVSANEACNILAERVAGSIEAFVEKMNEKAAALGCENTHFVNPSGLHDPDHYTSAWDVFLITKAAMEYPDFMRFCDTANVVIPATNMSDARNLWTTNHLLSTWRVIGYRNREAHGIKTGSTDAAGLCLISSAKRGELHFVSVILGAERIEENGVGNLLSFSETTRLFNYGFDNFSFRTIIESKEIIQEIGVTLSKSDYVTVHPARDVEVLFPRDLDPADLERVVIAEESVAAPVTRGQKLGTLELRDGDKVYASVDLLASSDVDADRLLVFWDGVKTFFRKPAVKPILIGLAALIAAFFLFSLFTGRRRRYGRRGARRGAGYRGRRRY